MHFDAISGIIDALDDCAVHADRWPVVLDRLVAATGSRAALLVPIRGRTPGQLKTSGAEELEASYFLGGWDKRDLRERGLAKMRETGVTVDQDFVSPEEMRRNPYYTEFLEPAGFRFFAGLGVRVADSEWALTLQRGKQAEPFTPDEQRALRLVQSHLQKAAAVEDLMAGSYARGRLEALDAEGSACLMLDVHGSAVLLNEPAERMVGAFFGLRGGRIHLASQKQDRALEILIASHLAGRQPPPSAPRLVADDPDRPRIVFEAIRLPRLETPFSRFALALRVRQLATGFAVDPGCLRPIFNLSSREASLLAVLCVAPDLADGAATLGISVGTARVHLKSIFAKTGTRKQSELLALAASLVRG